MASLAQSRRFTLSAPALVARSARCSPPAAPTRRRPPRPSAPCCARPAISSIRTRRSASPSPRRSRATRPCRWWCCRPRIRPSFPMRSRRPAGSGRRCPEWLSDLDRAPGARDGSAGRSGGGRALCPGGEPRRAGRSGRMSVEVTQLAVRHRRVTERCRIWRRPRSASGSVPAAATKAATSTASRTSSSTWRSRARGGAPRARSPRRSRRSAATSTRRPASRAPPITPACCKADVPLALDVLVRHPVRARLRPRRAACASRTSSSRRSAPSTTRRTIWFSSISRPPRFPISRSAARSWARPRPCARSTARSCATYLGAPLPRRPTWWWRRPARSITGRWSPRWRSASRASTGRRAPAPEPARFGGGTHVEKRELEQVHIALALPGVSQSDPSLYSLQVFTNVLGGGMSSRLFQEVREKRGLCYSIYAFHVALQRHRHVRPLCRHRRRRRCRTDAGRRRRDRRRGRDHLRSRDRARQGADESRSADGAGKLRRARRSSSRARCWPGAGRFRSRRWSRRSRR